MATESELLDQLVRIRATLLDAERRAAELVARARPEDAESVPSSCRCTRR